MRINIFVPDGYSGGPVINQNEVLGMILFGDEQTGTTVLKSEYIINKLKDLNLNIH